MLIVCSTGCEVHYINVVQVQKLFLQFPLDDLGTATLLFTNIGVRYPLAGNILKYSAEISSLEYETDFKFLNTLMLKIQQLKSQAMYLI